MAAVNHTKERAVLHHRLRQILHYDPKSGIFRWIVRRRHSSQERAVLDALSSVVFADDCQVVSMNSMKCYAEDGRTGVSVQVQCV